MCQQASLNEAEAYEFSNQRHNNEEPFYIAKREKEEHAWFLHNYLIIFKQKYDFN